MEPSVKAEAVKRVSKSPVESSTSVSMAGSSDNGGAESKLERMQQWVRNNRNSNTHRTYESGWKGFAHYLSEQGTSERKVTVADIADYLRKRFEEDRVAAATLAGDRAAIGDHFRFEPGMSGLHVDPLVSETLRIAMNGAAQSVPKQHVSAELMRELAAIHDADARSDWRGARNVAMLLTMMVGMLRQSEAVELRMDDVRLKLEVEAAAAGAPAAGAGPLSLEVVEAARVSSLTLHIRSSKTDQAGKGATVLLRSNSDEPALCPVRRLQAYLRSRLAAGIVSDFLFAKDDGSALARSTPCGIVQKLVSVANERAQRLEGVTDKWGPVGAYGSHSMRRGGVTEARASGVDMLDIQRHGRWVSGAVYGYVGPTNEQRSGVTERMFSPPATPHKSPAASPRVASGSGRKPRVVFAARSLDFKLAQKAVAQAAAQQQADESQESLGAAGQGDQASDHGKSVDSQSANAGESERRKKGGVKRKRRAGSDSSSSEDDGSDDEEKLLEEQEMESWQEGYSEEERAREKEGEDAEEAEAEPEVRKRSQRARGAKSSQRTKRATAGKGKK